MEAFQERLSRLAELSVDELNDLQAEVTEAFDAADADANLEDMQALADALDQIRQTLAEKEASVDDAAPDAAAPPVPAAAVPVAASAEGGEGEAPPAEPEAGTEAEIAEEAVEVAEEPAAAEAAEEAAAEEAAEAATEVEATVASEENNIDPATPSTGEVAPTSEESPVAAEVTAADVPEEAQPVSAASAPVTIRAGGDIPGVTAGSVLTDMDDVVDAMTRKINSMRGVTGDGEHVVVASLRSEAEPDDERVLRSGDMNGNAKKIRSLLGNRELLTPEGLTAAGWCAPRTPIYDVPTMGVNDRPIRSGLPSFNADRGGITWAQPPTLPTTDFGVGIWRYDGSDWGSFTNPSGSGSAGTTKPCYTIECGTEDSIDVDALTLCLCFNNMMVRAFPEWVRANTDLVMVAQARFAEQVALSQMFGVATTGTCGTPATSVGVARDFLYTVATAAAEKRWNLRLGMDAPLQLLAPSWLATAIAIDLGLQAPGDGTYAIGTSQVDGYFREFNVQPVWYMDDAPATAAFTDCAFPVNAHWLLYPTGTFLRLDTGELNLGVVRTKEDLEKNSYCEFSETFETVAYMGPADKSWVRRGLTAVNLFGATGAPIDLTV